MRDPRYLKPETIKKGDDDDEASTPQTTTPITDQIRSARFVCCEYKKPVQCPSFVEISLLKRGLHVKRFVMEHNHDDRGYMSRSLFRHFIGNHEFLTWEDLLRRIRDYEEVSLSSNH